MSTQDPQKAESNLQKHGLSFEEASTAFADPLSRTKPDPLHSDDEDRLVLMGVTSAGRLVVVAQADRGENVRCVTLASFVLRGKSTQTRFAYQATGHILMTMKPIRTLPAAEFKARCLEVLDRVARDGEAYVVTKRGKPVAKVVPVDTAKTPSLRGSVSYLSDITEPLGDDWPADP